MIRWFGGSWLVVSLLLLVGACGSSTSSKSDGDDGSAGSAGEGNGGECEPGDREPAGDGCNTCTCTDDGEWACTEIGCECTVGEMRPAGDDCNTCTCVGDGWACTDIACPTTCMLGDEMVEGCRQCTCGDFGDGPMWICDSDQCCEPGETRSSDGGCNTCDMDGEWQCTDRECEPCMFIGEVIDAGDDCNSCTCTEGGWVCTTRDCSDVDCRPGFANCNGDATDGCETDIANSYMNCGMCGLYCSISGAYAGCVDGECVIDHCQSGYADCNEDPRDGCEAPVTSGCDNRCEPAAGSPDPGPSMGSCMCPMGTTCVRGSLESDGEYCFPLPETCSGFGNCSCLGTCVCPNGGSPNECWDEMVIGGMIVNCHRPM
jgi:hypothetical protein